MLTPNKRIQNQNIKNFLRFLQLVLKDPTEELKTGEFTCEITTVTVKGHGATFTSSAVVDIKQTTIQDLVSGLLLRNILTVNVNL